MVEVKKKVGRPKREKKAEQITLWMDADVVHWLRTKKVGRMSRYVEECLVAKMPSVES